MPSRSRVRCTILAALLCSAAFTACGSRSTPQELRPVVGRDAGDAGAKSPDASNFTSPIDTLCVPEHLDTVPSRPVALKAFIESTTPITEGGFRLSGFPDGSQAQLTLLTEPNTAQLTPDIGGHYEIEFSETNSEGNSDKCVSLVYTVDTPPVAICSEGEVQTRINIPVVLSGSALTDSGASSLRWEVIEAPVGSQPRLTDADTDTLIFGPDAKGIYVVQLVVVNLDGLEASCSVVVAVAGAPVLECPTEPFRGPSRQAIELAVTAVEPNDIASHSWSVDGAPELSSAVPTPTDTAITSFSPDKAGDYSLSYVVTNADGLSASCAVSVIAEPSAPTVTCPARLTVAPLELSHITASAVDDGTIVEWNWQLISVPPGSVTEGPEPTNTASTELTTDVAGEYELQVTATDDTGMSATCHSVVAATNINGLRVEMFWDVGNSDMDLHLLNPLATDWNESNNECYWSNCAGGSVLNWGTNLREDNPHLDLDNTEGFGPENVNIFRPAPGTYRIGVHNWDHRNGVPSVTVTIYCKDSETQPRETFGPVALEDREISFWRVADVTIDDDGDCQITDLSIGGEPNINTRNDSRRNR